MKNKQKEIIAQEIIDLLVSKEIEITQFSRILMCAYKKVIANKKAGK